MKKASLILVVAAVVVAPVHAQVFVGTALNPSGTSNPAFTIDAMTDVATQVFTGRAVWGATYDQANNRVLFTSDGGVVGGDDLYQWLPAGGAPTLVGTITDVTGAPFRMDGLAISGGVLYGSRAAASADGIYRIDMVTLVATLIIPSSDSISGIDADPTTGTIYGVDDTLLQVVRIDPVGLTITPVAAYPDANETDIDGIGCGTGVCYLVPDDSTPGLIYVYNTGSSTFGTPLTAPWGQVDDTFSGGAFIEQRVVQPTAVPTLSHAGLALLVLLLGGVAVLMIRRR